MEFPPPQVSLDGSCGGRTRWCKDDRTYCSRCRHLCRSVPCILCLPEPQLLPLRNTSPDTSPETAARLPCIRRYLGRRWRKPHCGRGSLRGRVGPRLAMRGVNNLLRRSTPRSSTDLRPRKPEWRDPTCPQPTVEWHFEGHRLRQSNDLAECSPHLAAGPSEPPDLAPELPCLSPYKQQLSWHHRPRTLQMTLESLSNTCALIERARTRNQPHVYKDWTKQPSAVRTW